MKYAIAILTLSLAGCGTKITFRYEPPIGFSVETQLVALYAATQPGGQP